MIPSDLTNLTGILSSVAQIGQSDFTEAAYIAQKTVQYTKELTAKKLSKSEYDDLIVDLKVDDLICKSAEEQQIKETLQAYTTEILTLAATIAAF